MIKSIICGNSSTVIEQLPKNFVDLIITSPPYNAGHEYDIYNDNKEINEYISFLKDVFEKCFKILKDDGKLCVNVPFAIKNMKSKKVFFLATRIAEIINNAGFSDFEMITWHKGKNINHFQGNNTAWGSWKSPSCPSCRPMCECIMVFFKKERSHNGNKEDIDISGDEFKNLTKNAWYFKEDDLTYLDLICTPNNSKKSLHPAPYPIELIERIIKMYSYKGDVILDPFNGIGTTSLAAAKNNRDFIGIELSEKYCDIALTALGKYDPNYFVYDEQFSKLVNSSDVNDTLNNYFPYKESFSPKLFEALKIDDVEKIYDPFMGTGSSFLSPKLDNALCIGCDTNPLSLDITLAKLTKLSKNEINSIKKQLSDFDEFKITHHDFPQWRPYEKYVTKEKYNILMSFVDHFSSLSSNSFRFVKMLIVSNLQTFFDYKRDGNGIKYRKSKIIPSDMIYELKLLVKRAIIVKEEFDEKNHRKLDINKISSINHKLNQEIDCVITSPPYCNMFDYFEVYKMELWTSGLINDYDEWKNYKKTALRNNLNSNINLDKTNSKVLSKQIELLQNKLVDTSTIKMVNNYFFDINCLLDNIHHCLNKNRYCYIVVGNSFYSGVHIPTDEIICELAKKIGFKVEKIIVARRLSTSSQQLKILDSYEKYYLRESIVVLRRE